MFDKPTPEMVKHLKPLYVKAQINGKTIARVFVDCGAILNIIPLATLRKIDKKQKDLIPTNIKMTNFTIRAITVLGVLVVKIIVGPKSIYSAFFIVDAKANNFICWEEIGFMLVNVYLLC